MCVQRVCGPWVWLGGLDVFYGGDGGGVEGDLMLLVWMNFLGVWCNTSRHSIVSTTCYLPA